MPLFTIHPFPLCVAGNFVEVLNTTSSVLIDGERHQNLTSQLVLALGVDDPQGLRSAVVAAVRAFMGDEEEETTEITEEKEGRIEKLRRKDEESPTFRYTRQCNICLTSSPDCRAVLIVCGHTACLACVLRIEKNGRLPCPFCRTRTGYVKLYEEREEEEEVKGEKKAVEIENPVFYPPSHNVAPSTNPFPNHSTHPYHLFPFHSSPTHPTVTHPTVPSSPPNQSITLLIDNLPVNTTVEVLQRLLGHAGRVISVYNSTAFFGILARCQFADEQSARDAIQFIHGYYFSGFGRSLSVSIAQ